MNILFVLEYYYPHIGGVERLFKNIIDELAQDGHHVTIITNRYDKSLASIEHSEHITVRRYKFYNRYLFTFLAWIPVLFHLKGVDLIHTTSYNAGLPAWLAAKLGRKKVIITFHEYWGDLWDRLPWMNSFTKVLHASFEKMLVRLSFDRFVGVSDFTRNALGVANIPKEKVIRIYNGIDYERLPWESYRSDSTLAPAKPFTFTYFGRVSYSKGLDLLIPALAQLKENGITDFTCQLIVPTEGLFPRLQDMIASYELGPWIRLRHHLSESALYHAIGASDAVVIPSYSEGFCFAAVETMAIGTPIISSAQGALAEVVSGKHINIDSFTIDGLYQGLKKAIQGGWEYREKRRFPLSDTVAQYIQLYHGITDDDASSRKL